MYASIRHYTADLDVNIIVLRSLVKQSFS